MIAIDRRRLSATANLYGAGHRVAASQEMRRWRRLVNARPRWVCSTTISGLRADRPAVPLCGPTTDSCTAASRYSITSSAMVRTRINGHRRCLWELRICANGRKRAVPALSTRANCWRDVAVQRMAVCKSSRSGEFESPITSMTIRVLRVSNFGLTGPSERTYHRGDDASRCVVIGAWEECHAEICASRSGVGVYSHRNSV
jgi:hypothetical protein